MPALTVRCPTCQATVPWSEANAWRPFCSARCRGIDLGDWASDRFVIAGDDLPDAAGNEPPPVDELRH
jgi:endogenous inhibitor of DNA gyrase (YacG/DUF329 family)